MSNVSNVSILYFSRDCSWHVWWHRNVSCVQNQRMYTLWWMNRIFEHVWNEHGKCSFWIVCPIHVTVCPLYSTHPRSTWILHMRYMLCMCDIYHDFSRAAFLYRRVFKITVSNVSTVSNLYFSRTWRWHVAFCVAVSCVQNRRMYTLWWICRIFRHDENEHGRCSLLSVGQCSIRLTSVCLLYVCAMMDTSETKKR